MSPRLGINIDHIATLRQLRGTPYPDPVEAAMLAEEAGADQITVHLREDRRHIQDEDVLRLRKSLRVPLNLEMAVSPAIVRFALKVKPDWVCLVPEKRQEVTTEGGLNLNRNKPAIAKAIKSLKAAGIRVSLFIEPDPKAVRATQKLGADAVELHTGRYCLKKSAAELKRLREAAQLAARLGLGAHLGHGLDYVNVRPLAALTRPDKSPLIEEYNIGHSVICRAAIVGFERAVREMVSAIGAP